MVKQFSPSYEYQNERKKVSCRMYRSADFILQGNMAQIYSTCPCPVTTHVE